MKWKKKKKQSLILFYLYFCSIMSWIFFYDEEHCILKEIKN